LRNTCIGDVCFKYIEYYQGFKIDRVYDSVP